MFRRINAIYLPCIPAPSYTAVHKAAPGALPSSLALHSLLCHKLCYLTNPVSAAPDNIVGNREMSQTM